MVVSAAFSGKTVGTGVAVGRLVGVLVGVPVGTGVEVDGAMEGILSGVGVPTDACGVVLQPPKRTARKRIPHSALL